MKFIKRSSLHTSHSIHKININFPFNSKNKCEALEYFARLPLMRITGSYATEFIIISH